MSALAIPEDAIRWRLVEGDALELLRVYPACSVDAVVTDPPYGIGLHGQTWDGRDIRRATGVAGQSEAEAFERWTALWARECLRVLKPGGYLLAFGATRTAHRLAAGIEDAGFDLRDQLVWLYGCGVPKNGLENGRSSTLKPGYEPILLARVPLSGTLAENEACWGTGRLGIDETRLPASAHTLGRWPCNVALSHTRRCQRVRCTSTCPVRLLDRSRPAQAPSRFFYCSKPSRSERDAGCEALPETAMHIFGGKETRPRRNTHPTVKPVELMSWLVRLVCPPDGLVLDPFAGSGSTGVAALSEGRQFLGIERDPAYARIARARLGHAEKRTQAKSTSPGLDGQTVDGNPKSVSVRRKTIHPLERRHES
jgi:site-specific DNA-methyltransferase (adenine-specific)